MQILFILVRLALKKSPFLFRDTEIIRSETLWCLEFALKYFSREKREKEKKRNLRERKYGKLFIIVGTLSSIYGELFYLSLYFYTRWKISIIKEFLSSVFSRVWLCNPLDCSLLASSVLGIFQARILHWIAISFFRVSSQPRDWTQVSCIAGGFFTTEPPEKSKMN